MFDMSRSTMSSSYEYYMHLNKLTTTISLSFLLIIISFGTTGNSLRENPLRGNSRHNDGQEPYIDTMKFNTTVFVGQTAYLPCVVKHLGDKTVSWIRRRDLHILTSGSHTYTSDPRVSLLREGKLLNSWILKITTVGKKDEGYYECQVNTEPKMTLSHYLTILGSLNDESSTRIGNTNSFHGRGDTALPQLDVRIVDPKRKGIEAQIIGPQFVYIKNGHIANFTCVISHTSQPPNITWYLNDIPIQRSSATRGGISLETQKSYFSTISKLIIAKVYGRDEGKYSCGGEGVQSASVFLRLAPYDSLEEERVNELSGPMLSIANSNVFTWSQDKKKRMKMTRTRTTRTGIEFSTFFIDFLFSLFLKSSFLLSFLFSFLNPLFFFEIVSIT